MTLIYSVILCLFFKARICQLQCVKALTETPDVTVPPMTEGQRATLQCTARPLCSDRDNISWNLTNAGGRSLLVNDGIFNSLLGASILVVTPTADDHNTNITCVVNYVHSVVETTVTLNVKFSPKILNSSQCMVEGKLLVCVCISRGNPLAPITWPSLTDFSVTSSSSIQTVNSIITMSAADYHDTSVKCISSNELGRAEVEIPLQNYTENRLNYELDSNHSSNAVLPWIITGVSLSLNLILLTSLIICIKRCRGKSQQRELDEDMNTYASLNQADVGYSVISPRTRGVSRKGPGVARET
ncbi:uncharacterized protein LOC144463453 isoform X2 [Epinephelus lanceolatus]